MDKLWKGVLVTLAVIGSIIACFFIGSKPRWLSDIIKRRVSTDGEIIDRSKTGLDELDANQRSATERINDIENTVDRVTDNQRSASRITTDAKAKLDELDTILGVKKY